MNRENLTNDSLFFLNINLSNCYSYLLQFDSASKYLEVSYQLIDRNENKSQRVEWLFQKAFFMSQHEMSDSAIFYYDKVIYLCDSSLIEKLLQAKIRLGIEYVEIGKFNEGLAILNQNLEKQLKFYKTELNKEVGFTYTTLGYAFFRATNYQFALKYFEKSQYIFEKTLNPNNYYIGMVFSNLAIVFEKCGDYEKALKYYENAKYIFSTIFGKKSIFAAVLNNNISEVYRKKGKYSSALNYINFAIENLTNKLGEKHIRVAYGFLKKGEILKAQHKFYDAIKFLNKSIIIYEYNFNNSHYRISDCYIQLAECYKYLGNFDIANSYFMKANYILMNYYEYSVQLPKLYFKWAELCYDEKKYYKGLEYIKNGIKANDSKQHMPRNNSISANSVKNITLIQLYHLEAKIYYALYQDSNVPFNLNKAYEACVNAISVSEHLQRSFSYEGSKLELVNKTHPVIQLGVKCAYILYQHTKKEVYKSNTFKLIEKSKYAVLSAAITKHDAKVRFLPDTIYQKEQELKSIIAYYKTQLYLEKDSVKKNVLSNTIFEYQKTFEVLEKELEKNFPAYYQYKYKIPATSVEVIQQNIDSKQLMLTYFIGEEDLYVFSIGKKQFECNRVKIDNSFNNAIKLFRESMSAENILNAEKNWKHYTESASQLYSILISPIHHQLKEFKQLVIVPDGEMALIPFEALLPQLPTSNQYLKYNKLNYLIHYYTISYTNSALIWIKSQEQKKHTARNELLAYAPIFESDDIEKPLLADQQIKESKFTLEPAEDTIRGNLQPLKWSVKELDNISEFFVCNKFIGQAATERSFKEIASDYKILHIASHAIVIDEEPLLSKIYFSKDSSEVEDAALHLFELYNLNLNTDLVVLSACNTGYGLTKRGEGVFNLARGFMHAGSLSIVMSLWSANDRTTSKIMSIFYKGLSNGKNKASALRLAKLEYINQSETLKSHPYFWAQFVASGNMHPITKKRYNKLFVIISAIILVSLLLTMFLIKRYRTNLAKYVKI